MKGKKGYSLIEIVIGLVVITLFLLVTGSLVNASYSNYRLILQRNEALDFAINEMEEVLQEKTVVVSTKEHTEGNMTSEVKIENVTDGEKVYDDKVFLVTVTVHYAKDAKEIQKYQLQLKSLKIVE